MTDGGPVFPCKYVFGNPATGEIDKQNHTGMSLRDWFAGKALDGLIQRVAVITTDGTKLGTATINYDLGAGIAYKYADAMLKQREMK